MKKAPVSKPIHAKPSLYAYYFEVIKVIGNKYGYNIVLHGSLSRDLDLVAIPWQETIGDHDIMIAEIAELIGGSHADNLDNITHHGRMHRIININRRITHTFNDFGTPDIEVHKNDPQYYIDISIIPHK